MCSPAQCYLVSIHPIQIPCHLGSHRCSYRCPCYLLFRLHRYLTTRLDQMGRHLLNLVRHRYLSPNLHCLLFRLHRCLYTLLDLVGRHPLVHVMRLFESMVDVVSQGSVRRGRFSPYLLGIEKLKLAIVVIIVAFNL